MDGAVEVAYVHCAPGGPGRSAVRHRTERRWAITCGQGYVRAGLCEGKAVCGQGGVMAGLSLMGMAITCAQGCVKAVLGEGRAITCRQGCHACAALDAWAE